MTYFHSVKSIHFLAACLLGFASVPAVAEISINPYPLTAGSVGQFESPPSHAGAPVDLTRKSDVSRHNYAEDTFLPSVNISSPQNWNAFSGAHIRDIIAHWSEKSGVELIWHTDEDYDVTDNLDYQGSYEDAISALLQQYDGRFVRPVGTLHIDPSSGQKTLVITTHEGS